MVDLKKQLKVLEDKAEEQRIFAMVHGLSHENSYHEGCRDAFKLIHLLISTNLEIDHCTKELCCDK